MANLIFAYQDLSRYTLSATSTDASFPLSNLQTYYADDLWKSASTSAQTLVLDFGAATSCDYLVLENYAFGNADSVVLQGANDSIFTSGVTTVIGAGTIDPAVTPSPNPAYFSFTATSRRYWRLSVAIATPPLAAVPYVGNIFLGSKLDMGYSYDFPYVSLNKIFSTVSAEALDGRLRTAQSFGGRTIFELKLTNLPDTTKTSFQTFINTVRGALRPFYFLDYNSSIYYGHFDGDYIPMETQRYNLNNVKFKIKSQLVS